MSDRDAAQSFKLLLWLIERGELAISSSNKFLEFHTPGLTGVFIHEDFSTPQELRAAITKCAAKLKEKS